MYTLPGISLPSPTPRHFLGVWYVGSWMWPRKIHLEQYFPSSIYVHWLLSSSMSHSSSWSSTRPVSFSLSLSLCLSLFHTLTQRERELFLFLAPSAVCSHYFSCLLLLVLSVLASHVCIPLDNPSQKKTKDYSQCQALLRSKKVSEIVTVFPLSKSWGTNTVQYFSLHCREKRIRIEHLQWIHKITIGPSRRDLKDHPRRRPKFRKLLAWKFIMEKKPRLYLSEITHALCLTCCSHLSPSYCLERRTTSTRPDRVGGRHIRHRAEETQPPTEATRAKTLHLPCDSANFPPR